MIVRITYVHFDIRITYIQTIICFEIMFDHKAGVIIYHLASCMLQHFNTL